MNPKLTQLSIFICAFFLLYGVAFGQTIQNASAIRLIPHLVLNEKEYFKIISSTDYTRTTGATGRDSSVFDVTITVKDTDATGYLMQWEYTRCVCNVHDISPENIYFSNLLNIPFIYRVSKFGKFSGLKNYDSLVSVIGEITDSLYKANTGNPVLKVTFAMFKNLMDTREGFEQIILKYLKYYYINFGVQYMVDTLSSINKEMPSLFGTQPYKATEETTVHSVNTANQLYIIKHICKVNDNLLQTDVLTYAKKMAGVEKSPAIFPFDKDKLDYSDKLNQIVDINKGIILESLSERIIRLGIANRIIRLKMVAVK